MDSDSVVMDGEEFRICKSKVQGRLGLKMDLMGARTRQGGPAGHVSLPFIFFNFFVGGWWQGAKRPNGQLEGSQMDTCCLGVGWPIFLRQPTGFNYLV